MKKRFYILLLTYALSFMYCIPSFAAGFTDIANSKAREAIQKFSEKGYIKGYPDGSFRPDSPITRAEAVSILAKIGLNAVDAKAQFIDVSQNDWFFQPVTDSAKGGVIHGYTDNSFQPERNITRFEAISILSNFVRTDNYNAIQLPYGDADSIPSWVNQAVCNLYGAKVIEAYPENTINGNEFISRGEMVSMCTKIFENQQWNTQKLASTVFDNVTNPLPVFVDIPHDLIGYLTIESIGIKKYPVKDGDDLETIKTAIGHFADTPLWFGNIVLCGHNRDYKYDFRNLKNIEIGDTVTYQSRFGERVYKVTVIKPISETDWSCLENSQINQISMITCIESQPTQRLLVQAVQE